MIIENVTFECSQEIVNHLDKLLKTADIIIYTDENKNVREIYALFMYFAY